MQSETKDYVISSEQTSLSLRASRVSMTVDADCQQQDLLRKVFHDANHFNLNESDIEPSVTVKTERNQVAGASLLEKHISTTETTPFQTV